MVVFVILAVIQIVGRTLISAILRRGHRNSVSLLHLCCAVGFIQLNFKKRGEQLYEPLHEPNNLLVDFDREGQTQEFPIIPEGESEHIQHRGREFDPRVFWKISGIILTFIQLVIVDVHNLAIRLGAILCPGFQDLQKGVALIKQLHLLDCPIG